MSVKNFIISAIHVRTPVETKLIENAITFDAVPYAYVRAYLAYPLFGDGQLDKWIGG